MHIPDGYLSPSTCATLGAVMVPAWRTAARKVQRIAGTRFVPMLAVGAAYCFLVMMFNVPVPNGTTAHAVGAVLVAILLGPWAAVIAVSSALAIQALFFGDGGVLAFGANAFNMALLMPMVGYGVYLLVSSRAPLTSKRRVIAAGLGGYAGINAAALATAVEFGVQPLWFHSANGTPLYAPYHLGEAIGTMMFAHLLVAGVVEAVLTGGVVAYLQRANPSVLAINGRGGGVEPGHATRARADDEHTDRTPSWRWVAVAGGAMIALTPLGLLTSGGAFGEAAPTDLDLRRYHLDAVPSGLSRYAGFWHNAIFDGYGFGNDRHPVLGYIVSAAVGVVALVAVLLTARLLVLGLSRRSPSPTSADGIVS